MGRRQQWRLLAPRRRESLGQWDNVKDLMLDIDAVRTFFLHIALPICASDTGECETTQRENNSERNSCPKSSLPYEKYDAPMRPHLHSLPNELLLIIFSYLDIFTLRNIASSTRRLYSIALLNFNQLLRQKLAPWANTPLIFLGSRASDSGLPPGVLGDADADDLHLHPGFTLYLASRRWQDVSGNFSPSFQNQTFHNTESLRGRNRLLCAKQASGQYRNSARILNLQFFFPIDEGDWLLRNLTTHEYVHASYLEQVTISTFGHESAASWGYSMGLFLLRRIVWSERTGEARKYLGGQAAWAGHSFDSRKLTRSAVEIEGWTDISWEACKDLYELWERLHSDESARQKELEPPSTRRSRSHWRMHGYGT